MFYYTTEFFLLWLLRKENVIDQPNLKKKFEVFLFRGCPASPEFANFHIEVEARKRRFFRSSQSEDCAMS